MCTLNIIAIGQMDRVWWCSLPHEDVLFELVPLSYRVNHPLTHIFSGKYGTLREDQSSP